MKIKNCIICVAGGLILAFGLYNVHSLSKATEGGVLGLSLLLDHWVGISPALSGLILNALCYLLGWKVLGKEFIGYSAISGLAFSAFYRLFEWFSPVYPKIGEYPLLAAILGAVFVGICEIQTNIGDIKINILS